MGIYVNPGDSMFRFSLNSKIYVDKSPMINELNELIGTDERFLCMSRARRFGKTMMTNLMSAYYSRDCNSREIFERLELSKQEGWDKYLNAFNVIQIDFTSSTDQRSNINNNPTAAMQSHRSSFLNIRILPFFFIKRR